MKIDLKKNSTLLKYILFCFKIVLFFLGIVSRAIRSSGIRVCPLVWQFLLAGWCEV